MQSFYVDITKCRNAESDLASCQSNLNSANKKLDGAADGIRAMGGALASVGNSVEQLAVNASIEASEVEKLKLALHSIMNLYYAQEAGLIGQATLGATTDALVGQVADIANVAMNTMSNAAEYVGDVLKETVDRYIYTVINSLGDDIINEDGTIDFGELGEGVFCKLLGLEKDYFDTIGESIFTGEGGKLMQLLDDFTSGRPINIDDYDFLKDVGDIDLGKYIGDQFKLDTFDFKDFSKLSDLGKCCKIVGIAGEVLDGLVMVGEDFCEVFYNEETGNFEGFESANNWGYFATDVVIDGVVKIGANVIGDLVGTAAAAIVGSISATPGAAAGAAGGSVVPVAGTAAGAVAGGVTTGGVAAVVTQNVVSAIVSSAIEEACNSEWLSIIDVDGDGLNDSAVDTAKYIAHNLVDCVVEVAPQVYEATTAYVGDMINTASEYVGEIAGTVAETATNIYDSATEFATDVYNDVTEMASNVHESVTNLASDMWANTVDFAEDVLSFSWF